MVENEKKHGFMDIIKDGLSYISKIISASIFPQMAEGAEMVMNTIDDRLIIIERRILRKISSLLIIGFGGVFLIFALFFFLIEYLGWSSAAAYFSIGITVFVIGLLLKAIASDR
jgi:small-conductance mechanosensitive channel